MNVYALPLILSLLATPLFASTPLFWEVSKGKQTVYLLGTIHVGKASFYPLAPEIESALASSSILALEINPTTVNPLALQKYLIYANDSTLSMALPPAIYKQVEEKITTHLIPLGYPMEVVQKMRPWAVIQALMMQEIEGLGYDPRLGIEEYLITHAPQASIYEIEKLEEQMALFQSIMDSTFIKESLDQFATLEEDLSNMSQAWETGDSTTLTALVLDSMVADLPKESTVIDQLFYQRNIRMTQAIETLLGKKQPVFVAVGAGHFLGEKGIIALLKEKGYTVKRVALGK